LRNVGPPAPLRAIVNFRFLAQNSHKTQNRIGRTAVARQQDREEYRSEEISVFSGD
jgi:hypothetical protein